MFPVDTHTHTIASTHAYSTIHDYIEQAKRKGIGCLQLPITALKQQILPIIGIL